MFKRWTRLKGTILFLNFVPAHICMVALCPWFQILFAPVLVIERNNFVPFYKLLLIFNPLFRFGPINCNSSPYVGPHSWTYEIITTFSSGFGRKFNNNWIPNFEGNTSGSWKLRLDFEWDSSLNNTNWWLEAIYIYIYTNIHG